MKKFLFLCIAVLFLSSCYRSTIEFECVASYSNGTENGVIYKLDDKPTQYCYATSSTNIVLAGKYDKMEFCYEKDSIILCVKSGNKIEWYDLKGKQLKCNYVYASNEEYKKLYAKNPSLRYEAGLVWDSSMLFPEEISAEKLELISSKNVTLPKKKDVYTCDIDCLEKGTLEKLGFHTSRQFKFFRACILLAILMFAIECVIKSMSEDDCDKWPTVERDMKSKMAIVNFIIIIILLIGGCGYFFL